MIATPLGLKRGSGCRCVIPMVIFLEFSQPFRFDQEDFREKRSAFS